MARLLIILLLVSLALANPAQAAQPDWLTGLLGQPVRAHRVAHHRPPPAVVGATPAALADVTPIVPLPRPRPSAPENAANAPASSSPTATDAAGTSVTPLPPSPADQTPTPPAPPATGAPETALQSTAASSSPAKPPRVYQTACPAVIEGLVVAKPLPPIAEGMCQEQSPLSVTSILVNGRLLPLSVPAIFNCEMASDLPGWVAEVDNYIFAMQKTRIKAVTVGGSFECRDRNVEGGSSDLSEHGRADALDFVGFTLEDGRALTVGQDYNSPDAPTNRLMHFAHDAACTRFTTVLGPDANALHHDHFHLDLGCHGQSCTYRLCE